MTIRFAKRKDIEQIVELCELHAAYERAAYDSQHKIVRLSNYLFDAPNGLKCLVVEAHEELVGYAAFIKQFSTWDAEYYIYLDCLYLKEKTRGKGVGKQLMQRIKEYAIAQNCAIIQWQTPDFNKNAIGFYKKLGAEAKAKERFTWKV